MNLIFALFEWRILGSAGPHVLSTGVLFIGCFYIGFFLLKRSSLWKTVLTVLFLITFAFMLHELFFNPIVDLWNLFTNPSVIIGGYEKLNYPGILLLMAFYLVGVWYHFFQGEFHLRQGGWWWVLWGGYCVFWWGTGFHTSLPFWFQSSVGWPWLHDPEAHIEEFFYTVTFMLAFVHCWKENPNAKIVGWLPRVFR